MVGRFWSHAKQQVEGVSNFIRKQNNFTVQILIRPWAFLLVHNYFCPFYKSNFYRLVLNQHGSCSMLHLLLDGNIADWKMHPGFDVPGSHSVCLSWKQLDN